MQRDSFDDEMLMAYADGELPAAECRQLEQAMAGDATLAQRVEHFRSTRRAAREALDPLLAMPAPAGLEQRLRNLAAEAASRKADAAEKVVRFPAARKPALSRQDAGLPLAAAIALMIGASAGYLLAPAGGVQNRTLALGAIEEPEIFAAMEEVPSGSQRTLGSDRAFRAIATFRDPAGTLCREFEVDGTQTTLVAVACRTEQAWQMRFAVEAGRSAEGYAPASSLDSLEAYLTATQAGEPLSAEEELAALRQLQ